MGILWMILLAIVSVVSLLLIGLKIYLKMKMGICTSTTDLTGKTVMVTGANTGTTLRKLAHAINRGFFKI